MSLAWGTVGWDDEDVFYEHNDTPGDGNTLVRVTLFRGRDLTKPLDQTGRAQGQRILAKLASGVTHLPDRNTRVLVGMPDPHGTMPANAVIVHADNPNPAAVADMQPGETVFAPGIGGQRGILRADGSIEFTTPGGVKLHVGPDKIELSNGQSTLTIQGDTITLNGQIILGAGLASTALPIALGVSAPSTSSSVKATPS